MSSRYPELSERQKAIFTALLRQYITTAHAVGSRQLAKQSGLNLSPATIRNVMADLEEMGLLTHPHTSAGRVPTTRGYGYYVDDLMEKADLNEVDRKAISEALEEQDIAGVNDLLENTGNALAKASTLISVVLSPRLAEGILYKIDLVRIATGRILVVLSIRGGFVRSILLEVVSEIRDEEVQAAARLLNERLSGLKLAEIRNTIAQRIAGTTESRKPLLRKMVGSADSIFQIERVDTVRVDGTSKVLEHPEFADVDMMRAVIEMVENRDVVIHLLEQGAHEPARGVRVTIGDELEPDELQGCSVVAAAYSLGETEGNIGIIGPTRMDYPRIVSLVNFAASAIGQKLYE